MSGLGTIECHLSPQNGGFLHQSGRIPSFLAENPNILLTCRGKLVITIRVQTGRVWGCSSLAEVRIQEGESLENALRRFKRKVQQEDIVKEVKRHSFYLKPGEKKRVKEALARKRSRKKARKEQD